MTLTEQFIVEVKEYLAEASRGFLALEHSCHDGEIINGIFRNFHTIKGISGIFPEYAPITSLTHVAEDLMHQVRSGERDITPDMVDLLLATLDLLSSWLDELEQGGALPADAQTAGDALRSRIIAIRDKAQSPSPAEDSPADQTDEPVPAQRQIISDWAASLTVAERARFTTPAGQQPFSVVCYTPDPDCFFFGEDPVILFRELESLEWITAIIPGEPPGLDDLDPFSCRLTFLAVTAAEQEQLDSIFGYVLEQVLVVPLSEVLPTVPPPEAAAKTTITVGEETAVTDAVALSTQEPHPAEGEISKKGGSGGGYIRVDQALINRLMDLVGEITIAKNSLPFLGQRASAEFNVPLLAAEIDTRHATINYIVEGLQDVAMEMRMLPVSKAFERFPRLVRDISRKLGKNITLVMEGDETRADKDVIEALPEPLVHLVRNSLDHGIEMPEERAAAGKPVEARILLRAMQDNSSIVIEIIDDGKGIDPEVVRRKAAEKGIMPPDALAAMADKDVVRLVIAPDFSTADSISDLSGRGVGMDAVNAMVTSFGGSIDLSSVVGAGTTVRLSLPLSLAITKVLIVRHRGCTFGVPADDVIESLIDIPPDMINTVRTEPGLDVRGELYPLYSLSRQLGMEQRGERRFPEKFSAVVVRVRGEVVALAVEEFNDIIDVMVKPLQGMLAGNRYYTGNTILGDGSIMFILNMPEVVAYAG